MKTLSRLQKCWKLNVVSFLVVCGAIASSGNYAVSQVIGDNTLGTENSLVTSPIPGTLQIDGGATRGTNLFHSFSDFSVPSNGIAYFNNALNIQNIMTRVTGESVSNIDGLIAANGTANLFLINPNGIIFSPNASLRIGGSFLASTASSLNFVDATQFSATNPQTPPLLSISVPLGLQYGGNAGSIQVQGSRLQVPNGKTLALVGGNVQLNDALLEAPGGRVELGGLAGVETIELNLDDNNLRLSFPDGVALADISLSNAALVDVSGEGGGNIQVQGRRITLTDESTISANTLGSQNGGSIFLRASQLSVQDGSVISAGTFGTGSGGTLTVIASDFVELIGISADGLFPSSLSTSTHDAGQAGELRVDTRRLIVRDGGRVSASTFGTGKGGTLIVNASDAIELTGVRGKFFSGLFTRTIMGNGTAGDLRIATGRLIVRNGALVDAGTFDTGKGGSLFVNASESVEVMGTSPDNRFASALSVRVNPGAKGDAGNLVIQTRRLLVGDGAQVSAGTSGAGNGGRLTVSASDFVELIGTSANGFPSRLTTQTFNVGTAGDLTIATGQLIIRDKAQVAVNSRGTGNAGNLEVTASSILLDKQGQLTAETALGQGGNISLQVQDLLLMRHGGGISTTAGTAQAGGDGGNIRIDTDFIVAAPTENSDITANAYTGRGGNINITAQGIYGIEFRPKETSSSDITASSQFGVNGVVTINTPDVDPSRGLAELPVEPVNVEVAQGCQAGGKQASIEFFNRGKGGLAPNPYEPLSSNGIWEDVPAPTQRTASSASADRVAASPTTSPNKIVEAQGWLMNEKGHVVLVAQMPTSHSQGRCRLH